jgi:flagellar hook-associated protein 3 FlgL
MIPSIQPSSDLFLSSIERIQNQASRAQQQISSGARVSTASDAPDDISSILVLRSQISGVEQVQRNLANVSPRVDSAESAIQQAIQVLDTATTLAAQAVSGTADASQRADLAPQVQALLEQLVSLTQTSVNGHYVFSGDQDQNAAFTVDLTSGNGVKALITPPPGPPGQVQDANGLLFSIGMTAQNVFDSGDPGDGTYAPQNVFAAVAGLLNALKTNNVSGPGGIEDAVSNIKASSAHLNDVSSSYGAAQNRISDATESAGNMLVSLQKQLRDEQDTDVVQATLDLNSALNQLNAAMAAEAKLKPQSLFDYLG